MSSLTKGGKEFARSHDDARAAVCCVCGKKVKDNKKGGRPVINSRLESLVCQFVHKNYSILNTAYPTAICGSCRLTLCSLEKVILNVTKITDFLCIFFRIPRAQGASFLPSWIMTILPLLPPKQEQLDRRDVSVGFVCLQGRKMLTT